MTVSPTNTTSMNNLNECVVYSAPLCYPGICETPEGANPNVDIFVKRLPASVGSPGAASNVWLLQGGPGASSTGFEGLMETLHSKLGGAVNVYLMTTEHTTAQATTSGSSFGTEIDPSEVPQCAKDLQIKDGDLASFSMTSAASDLAAFISKYTNGRTTIVYGVSYGTMFAERLMHLAPPEVTGYVLDGVATMSEAPADKLPYFSNWDLDFGEVGDVFLSLSEEDSHGKDRVRSTSLGIALQNLIDQFDRDSNSI
ncbi:hypothetical protein PHMEG_00022088 [Phytophthora megakarya]|uniref:AB hydrolase-1 domain-containing protein n=1 Tax=Phytophthora megakarya TaxID=4795 RepID=A0A225VLX0_9STRA|nr:hypothetical protein PHMEG_00022088 [Phytophthora megakarya]